MNLYNSKFIYIYIYIHIYDFIHNIYIYIRISFITGGETKTEKDGQGLCLRPPKSARVGPRARHWQLTVPIYHDIYMLKKKPLNNLSWFINAISWFISFRMFFYSIIFYFLDYSWGLLRHIDMFLYKIALPSWASRNEQYEIAWDTLIHYFPTVIWVNHNSSLTWIEIPARSQWGRLCLIMFDQYSINHPPVITIFIGGIDYSQSWMVFYSIALPTLFQFLTIINHY